MEAGITVIIPVKLYDAERIPAIINNMQALQAINNLPFEVEVICVDSSIPYISDELQVQCSSIGVGLILNKDFQPTVNNKLVSVLLGIKESKYDYIMIVDDDCRPTYQALHAVYNTLPHKAVARCRATYDAPSVFDLVDLSGSLLLHILSSHKQYWGNISIRKSAMPPSGIDNVAVLFDELALERSFEKAGFDHAYITDATVAMSSHRTIGRFLEQRVRYAYENMATPLRFVVELSILPLLTIIAWKFGPFCALALFLFGAGIIAGLAFRGQQAIRDERLPFYTWALAPIWFLSYIPCSWIAIALWCSGGICFGGARIRKPA